MKLKSHWVLYVILAWIILFCYWVAFGQNLVTKPGEPVVINHVYSTPGRVGIEWKAVDDTRVWLTIVGADATSWQWEGYHPSFTYILVRYKPVVRQIAEHEYEITFLPDKL